MYKTFNRQDIWFKRQDILYRENSFIGDKTFHRLDIS